MGVTKLTMGSSNDVIRESLLYTTTTANKKYSKRITLISAHFAFVIK